MMGRSMQMTGAKFSIVVDPIYDILHILLLLEFHSFSHPVCFLTLLAFSVYNLFNHRLNFLNILWFDNFSDSYHFQLQADRILLLIHWACDYWHTLIKTRLYAIWIGISDNKAAFLVAENLMEGCLRVCDYYVIASEDLDIFLAYVVELMKYIFVRSGNNHTSTFLVKQL